MARLTIEQVKAPDFSASSEMLARANQSFNAGMESAKGILDSYNEGQQAKGDQALIGALAGLESEEDLANFLRTTDLASMNISDTMRQNILDARSVILGNNQTRQATINSADANARENAGEARTAANYLDDVARRNEQRALTPVFMRAVQEAQRYGFNATPNEREMLAATLQAEAGGEGMDGMIAAGAVIRNRAELGRYGGNTISGVIMQPGQFSAWNGVTGYAGGEGAIDMANLRVSEDAYRAADAILSGNYQDPTGGATHYYNPSVATPAWGKGQNPSGAQWTTIGNHVFGNPDGVRASASGAVPNYTPGQITSNPAAGPGMIDFTSALMAGAHMMPDEALALYNRVLGQQKQGQEQIDAAEQKRQQEAIAAGIIGAIQDPNNLTAAAVTSDILSIPGVSASNLLAAGAQDRSAFADVISPNVAPSAEVNAALDRANTEAAGILANDPLVRSFELAKSFDEADDMGAALLSEFEIPEGSSMNSAYANRVLTRMARDAGVTPGEMAATLSSMSDGNYEQFDAMINASSDSDIYESVKQVAQKQFNAEAKSSYETLQADAVRESANRDSLRLQIAAARASAAKIPAGTSERAAADQQVALMEAAAMAKENPVEAKKRTEEYLASRILGFEPGSIAGNRAKLEAIIQSDDSLSTEEKLLLILGLRV